MKTKTNSPISWGSGLVIAIAAFMVSTLGFVFFATTLDFDLVTEQHYEEGVEYQQVIDRVEQTHALSQPVAFNYQKSDRALNITFPKDVAEQSKQGTLTLYRPDDATLDQEKKLSSFTQNGITVEEIELPPGKWTAQLKWSADQTQYYSESTLFVE
ncbi:MAG: FixH family protein [Bacteroidota bacterium]